MLRLLGLLHRLGRNPEMLAQIFRRRLAQMRHLVLEQLPVLVHAPAERGHPAKTRLDHHDLEVGKALEHAFEDEACRLRLAAGGVLGHLLDVERRPAGIAGGASAGSEHVDADGEARLDRRFIDRPVGLLADQVVGPALEQHMGEALVAGAQADFLDRGGRVLERHHHRRQQPRIARVPVVELEFVHREAHGGAEFRVLVALPARRERIHDRVFDRIDVEELLLHKIEIARRQPAAGRPAIAARGLRLHLGIGKPRQVPLARARAVGLRMVPPALAEIGPQILERALRMDVDIEDLQAGLLGHRRLAHFHVHQASSLRRA